MVDIVAVCAAAADSQPNQTLAIVLAIFFNVYIIVAILLSALSIFSAASPALLLKEVQAAVAVPIELSGLDVTRLRSA